MLSIISTIFHISYPLDWLKYILLSMELQDSQPAYNLFGCIVHSGLSPESGHYYAYVKVIKDSISFLCSFDPFLYIYLNNDKEHALCAGCYWSMVLL
jgi:hypothetical protein